MKKMLRRGGRVVICAEHVRSNAKETLYTCIGCQLLTKNLRASSAIYTHAPRRDRQIVAAVCQRPPPAAKASAGRIRIANVAHRFSLGSSWCERMSNSNAAAITPEKRTVRAVDHTDQKERVFGTERLTACDPAKDYSAHAAS